jgi:outer membrane protein OmpA-like peptidoglycan-associated protein
MKPNRYVFVTLVLGLASGLIAQSKPAGGAACVDSKTRPALPECRVDACERRAIDQRTVPVREDEKGEAVNAAIDGPSRSTMYECREGVTHESLIKQAGASLRDSGFTVLYQYVGMEGSITARKDDLWVLLEAASRYYTLTEMKVEPPEFESITDAAGLADAIERYGHVAVYGIKFAPARGELQPESAAILHEIVTMLDAHPDWHLRVEGHTDEAGARLANMTLSARRAAAVVSWLTGAGVKRLRLDSSGLGETRPVVAPASEEARHRNRRIELVKVSAAQ